jgi:hypothetical protein
VIYSENEEVPEAKGPWAFLYENANKCSLIGTIKNIRDHFLNTSEIKPAQFLFFERPFREQGKLTGVLGNNYARPSRLRQGSYLSVKVA